MTTHDDIHRDMGRMEGRLEAVNDHLGKIDKTLESIDQRLACHPDAGLDAPTVAAASAPKDDN